MTQLSGLIEPVRECETNTACLFLGVPMPAVMCFIEVMLRLMRRDFVEGVPCLSGLSALAGAVFLTVSLSACGSDESVSEPSPIPTVPEEVLWAGSVCAAFDAVLATVDAVGEGLTYEPTADADVLDQYVTQLQVQLSDINGAVEDLAFTVGQVPTDFKERASNVVSFGEDISAIVAAKDDAIVHIESAMAAESNVDKGLEAAQAAVTGATALSLTREFLGELGTLLSERRGDLNDAFGQASECQ